MGPLQCAPGPPPTAFSQDPPRIRSRERTSLVKNRMREICTSGSVRGEGGNILTYSAASVSDRSGPRGRVPCSARKSCSRSCAKCPTRDRPRSTVTAPPGTVMNATHPAAVNGRTSTCQRAADLVLRALAQAAPERVIAAGNGSCATASFSGADPNDGHLWVYLETIGGGSGARAGKDGLD